MRVEKKLQKQRDMNRDDPKLGVVWYILHCFAESAAMILIAYLFLLNDNPDDMSKDLSPFQMLVGRSIIGLVVMIIWLNFGLKKAVWDSLKREQVRPLVFRSI